MHFTKMHGAGNDYIYVDCFAQSAPADPAGLARAISDRRYGVGSDGLILMQPADDADARMQMYNADGSFSEMCGNGIRCVAKYLYDHGVVRREAMQIASGDRIYALDLHTAGGKVEQVRVDMGVPILQAAEIPTTLPGDPPMDVPLAWDDGAGNAGQLSVCCLSMGNPHCVTFVREASDALVLGAGPLIEYNTHFPQRTNVEFVELLNRGRVRQRTWERGSGETFACGTGACAVCVAGVLTGRTDRELAVELRGGTLTCRWDESTDHVFMTGPAVEVFRGEYPVDS